MKNLLLLMLGGVLLSCSSATKKSQLEDNVRNYFLSLRRSDSPAAISFVHPNKKEEFLEKALRLDSIHISLTEVDTIFPNEDLSRAIVSARLEFFSPDQMGLHSVKRKFIWVFHPEAKTWLLDETGPFGSPFQSSD